MDAKTRDLISIIVGMAVLLAVLFGARASTGDAVADLGLAQGIFSDPARREAEACNAVGAMLDAAAAIASGSRLDPAVRAKLAEARDLFAEDPHSLGQAATLVNESYALLHAGAPFAMPAELRSMPEIIEHMRARLADSRRHLEKGEPDQAVTVLVELLAMAFTPVEASGR